LHTLEILSIYVCVPYTPLNSWTDWDQTWHTHKLTEGVF